MNITSDIKSVTYLKSKAADLLSQITTARGGSMFYSPWKVRYF